MKITKATKRKVAGSSIGKVSRHAPALSVDGRLVEISKVIDTLRAAERSLSRHVVVKRVGDGRFIIEANPTPPLVTGDQDYRAAQLEKAKRFARRHVKDIRFSRGANALKDAESRETTDGIARALADNLQQNDGEYKLLLSRLIKA